MSSLVRLWTIVAVIGGCSSASVAPSADAPRAASRSTPRATATAAASAQPAVPPGRDALGEQLDRCAGLAIADVLSDEAPDEADSCTALAAQADVLAEVEHRCDDGDAPSCSVAGALLRGRKTLAVRYELVSPPCPGQAGGCHGQQRSAVQLPMGDGADAAAASRRLTAACEGGVASACVEVAELAERSAAGELYRKSCLAGAVAGCAPAVYLELSTSRLIDPELARGAGAALRRACDGGSGMACNSLGFMAERKLVEGDAAALYAAGCHGGASIACANLTFLAEKEHALRASTDWSGVSERLGEACRLDPKRDAHCLAHAVTLLRGHGVRRSPSARTQLVKLCRGGYAPACTIR